MTRRHFMKHLAGASAMAVPAMQFTSSMRANAAELQKNQKAAILMWMGGG
ncbi:MAG: twin-arginine translocation signal domain-containing protein, partial [Pirellulales bacterium]